jgi:hypothetical protein
MTEPRTTEELIELLERFIEARKEDALTEDLTIEEVAELLIEEYRAQIGIHTDYPLRQGIQRPWLGRHDQGGYPANRRR